MKKLLATLSLVLVACFAALGLAACKKTDKIVGTWKFDADSLSVTGLEEAIPGYEQMDEATKEMAKSQAMLYVRFGYPTEVVVNKDGTGIAKFKTPMNLEFGEDGSINWDKVEYEEYEEKFTWTAKKGVYSLVMTGDEDDEFVITGKINKGVFSLTIDASLFEEIEEGKVVYSANYKK